MTEINGSVAVVTGGASGIGLGIATQLVAEGATVVIADVEAGALERSAGQIGATGLEVDVSDPASVEALAQGVTDAFGRVDIVVNNAGIGPQAPISELTLADWRFVLDVNLYGVIHGVHTFLPLLESNEHGGHIVNTGSMASFDPQPGLGAYAVTKYGVAALTEVLRKELKESGSNVSATYLAPGTVRTNIKDSLRNRGDVASSALFDVDISQGPAGELRWQDPIDTGRVVTRAIRNDDALAITHPEWWSMVEEHNRLVERAFAKYPPL